MQISLHYGDMKMIKIQFVSDPQVISLCSQIVHYFGQTEIVVSTMEAEYIALL